MAKVESIEATLVVKTDNILGECPLWSGNEVLWVDIDGEKFWAYVLLTSTFAFRDYPTINHSQILPGNRGNSNLLITRTTG